MTAKMKFVSIDSIGEKFAVCEDDNFETVYINISDLPDGASQGDIIQVNDDGSLEVNKKETKRRRDEIIKLQDKLWK